ncbi:DNA-directed RNA polymerase subunit RPC12/RpoP [Desulfohalotomaculum tongense]|uniref:hypothetical protein n=1 Tax=Desulforadius tongensis TaxID=1216062 RepID=UPI001959F9B8|nr:hypothetical protein [Desulforadius tongensis]MBM7854586.1 DNA-directed RNA polymerase subunit RPC12/RpoP [Desulforadius tongensis]
MPKVKYVCSNCNKEFSVKYLLMKPKDVQCPYCDNKNVKEKKAPSACGCGVNYKGIKFT